MDDKSSLNQEDNEKKKTKAEKFVDEMLNNALRSHGSSSSIDSDYDLIRKILDEENEVGSSCSSAWKPKISKYADAIIKVEGIDVFVPEVGDKVVIEYPEDWQDSVYGTVKYINEETGDFRVWNERKTYYTSSNFIKCVSKGIIVKLGPPRITALRSSRNTSNVKKVSDGVYTLAKDDKQKKKGRGRPKGSKNRPKSVIEAERKKIELERKMKKERREIRRKIKSMKIGK